MHTSGCVEVHLGEKDRASLVALSPGGSVDRVHLEANVAHAAAEAFDSVRKGEVAQAERQLGIESESTLYRVTMWRDGLRLSTDSAHNLVFGIGMDSTKKHWQEWGMFRGGFMPFGHFHSTPLQLLVERGLPALAIWLAIVLLYGVTLVRAIRSQRRSTDNWLVGILLGCLGGLVGLFVSGIVHYNLGDGEVALIFYLLMAVGVRTSQIVSGNYLKTAEQRMDYRMAA